MRYSIVLVVLCLCACVSSGDHEKVKADLAGAQAKLSQTEEELASKGRQVTGLDAQVTEAEARAKDLEQEIKRLEEKLVRERAERKVTKDMLIESETKLATQLKDKKKLKASVAEMRTALDELKRRKKQADARIKQFKDLLGRFRKLIDAGKLKVKIDDGRMVVELATDVLFGSGSARLSKAGKVAVGEVAEVLKTIEGRKFQVEGHTDNVPIRTKKYPSNWHLAAARAVTVVREMVSDDMPAESVSAASYGDARPVALNRTKEGRAANRRIEVVVVPDLSSLPGFEELKAVGR